MLTAQFFNLWQTEWLLAESVEFDGATRRIYVHPGVTKLSVREDIYSAWKRWMHLQNNTGFPAAIRTTGGDPIGVGQKSGDIYFLLNGWRIVIDTPVEIDGILYHDDGVSPYIVNPGGGVVATVSSLTQLVEVGGSGGSGGATASQIWGQQVASLTSPGSVGALLRDLSTDTASVKTNVSAARTDIGAVSAKVTSVQSDVDAIDAKLIALADDVQAIEPADNTQVLTAIGVVETKIDAADDKVETLAAATNLLDDKVDGLVTSVAAISAVATDIQTDVVAVATNIVTVTDLLNTLLKYETNRTRVDQVAKTLTVYDNDGVTPLKVFNLRNFVGQGSVTEIAERSPI